MALPSSGPLSLNDIQTEFGGSNPISLSEYYAGGGLVPAGTSGTYGAVPSSGQISIQNFYGTSAVVTGSQSYTTGGTYSWVAPTGVTAVSVVVVGAGAGGLGGGGGEGGALRYVNNIAVTAGSSYSVVVGASGAGIVTATCGSRAGGYSYFNTTGTVYAKGGNNTGGTNVGTGGNGGSCSRNGGGGAGGYSGNGGVGGYVQDNNGCAGAAGSGGAGGGGGGAGQKLCGSLILAPSSGGGGGVGLNGSGSNGAGGAGGSYNSTGAGGGGGGSGGATGGTGSLTPCFGLPGGVGGAYGGGGGSGGFIYCCCVAYFRLGGNGGSGAVRIVWPGATRSFPSTNVGSP